MTIVFILLVASIWMAVGARINGTNLHERGGGRRLLVLDEELIRELDVETEEFEALFRAIQAGTHDAKFKAWKKKTHTKGFEDSEAAWLIENFLDLTVNFGLAGGIKTAVSGAGAMVSKIAWLQMVETVKANALAEAMGSITEPDSVAKMWKDSKLKLFSEKIFKEFAKGALSGAAAGATSGLKFGVVGGAVLGVAFPPAMVLGGFGGAAGGAISGGVAGFIWGGAKGVVKGAIAAHRYSQREKKIGAAISALDTKYLPGELQIFDVDDLPLPVKEGLLFTVEVLYARQEKRKARAVYAEPSDIQAALENSMLFGSEEFDPTKPHFAILEAINPTLWDKSKPYPLWKHLPRAIRQELENEFPETKKASSKGEGRIVFVRDHDNWAEFVAKTISASKDRPELPTPPRSGPPPPYETADAKMRRAIKEHAAHMKGVRAELKMIKKTKTYRDKYLMRLPTVKKIATGAGEKTMARNEYFNEYQNDDVFSDYNTFRYQPRPNNAMVDLGIILIIFFCMVIGIGSLCITAISGVSGYIYYKMQEKVDETEHEMPV